MKTHQDFSNKAYNAVAITSKSDHGKAEIGWNGRGRMCSELVIFSDICRTCPNVQFFWRHLGYTWE